MNGMTRKEIDAYFTEKYDFLNRIAKGLCFKKNRKYPSELAITEAYLEVISHKRIPDLDTLQRYVISRITLEITASRSKLNYQDKLSQSTDFIPPDLSTDEIEPCLIDAYRENLKDTEKRIVLEAFCDKNYSSQRKLSEYFDLSQTTTHFLMKEIKEDIKKFVTFEKKQHGKV